MGDIEPFGFADGVSQPTFDWDVARTPGTKADRDYTNRIALGELLLGYYNEYGLLTESPKLSRERTECRHPAEPVIHGTRHDLGRNGTYLVFRQLAQDVRGFWRWVARGGRARGVDHEELAEAMVGRGLTAPARRISTGPTIPGVDAADCGRQRLSCSTPIRTAFPARSAPISGAPIRAPATPPGGRGTNRQSPRHARA